MAEEYDIGFAGHRKNQGGLILRTKCPPTADTNARFRKALGAVGGQKNRMNPLLVFFRLDRDEGGLPVVDQHIIDDSGIKK